MNKLILLLGIALAAFVAGSYADCHDGGCGEDFKGFGTEPGKCGCCPWPCCCKCVDVTPPCDTTPTPTCPCVDLSFIVDASGSVSPFVWDLTLQFVQDVLNMTMRDLAESYPGCDDIVNMAMITFGDNATLHWGLTPAANVINDILNVVQAKRFTNAVEAMELAINEVYSAPSDCVPFVVFITDGRSIFRKFEFVPMADALRSAVDGNIACIGVTNSTDPAQLIQLCPGGFIQLEDQAELIESIVMQVSQDIEDSIPVPESECPEEKTEECFCCCTPEQFWGMGGASRGPRGY